MKTILTSTFFWRFVGGFALGSAGVLALHPAGAAPLASPTIAQTAR